MAVSDKKQALRDLVDGMPFGDAQRDIALARIERASLEEATEILRLHGQVMDHLPDMMKLLKRPAPTAAAAVEATPPETAAAKPRLRVGRLTQKAKRSGYYFQRAGITYGAVASERIQPTDANRIYAVAKDRAEARTATKSSILRMAKKLIRYNQLAAPRIVKVRDKLGKTWRIKTYVGTIKGQRVEIITKTPIDVRRTRALSHRTARGASHGEKILATLINGAAAYLSADAVDIPNVRLPPLASVPASVMNAVAGS